ncbi:MAG: GNAT family N-acetyltransferase [Dehalococcoidia bacterium]
MQTLAQEVWRLAPQTVNVDGTAGELAWSMGPPQDASDSTRKHRLWSDDSRVAAWGVIFPPTMVRVTADRMELSKAGLVWQVHPDRPELLGDILDWFTAETPGVARQTFVRSANADAIARIERRGYAHDAAAPWDLLNIRDLREIEKPSLPYGYRLTTMREVDDVSLRVAVHRAAWEPSGMTEEKYAAAMATWPYRAELDFVVVAPDGSLATSALGWYDEDNHAGEFEPVGTHPAHRRLGLARAVLLFGMQRFRDAGAEHAIIGCRGDAGYPAPKLVYESVGFRELSRDMPFVQT